MSFAIEQKYDDLGRDQGFLGAPVSEERLTPNSLGSYRHYQGGSIYVKSADVFAHEIHGLIRDKWAQLGWENSFLGFPISDELPVAGRGRASRFEGGAISWTQEIGAHEVHGAIFRQWKALHAQGDPEDGLGFPLTDELVAPDQRGRYSHFEQGSIYWTPTTGARDVTSDIRQVWADAGWERGPLGYPVTSAQTLVSGTDTLFQDFERGTIFANGGFERVITRNGSVVAGVGPLIRWSDFASTMADGDWISFSCTGKNPNAPVTLTLQAEPGVHGWKGISLWSPSKGDLFEVSTDGDRRTSSVDIPPAALDANGLFLQFKKAKAFGVHTGMYWLSRPDKMLGNNIHFGWFHE